MMMTVFAAALAAAAPVAAPRSADPHAQHSQHAQHNQPAQQGAKGDDCCKDMKSGCCKDMMAKMHGSHADHGPQPDQQKKN